MVRSGVSKGGQDELQTLFPEKIIGMLRETEIALAQGMTVGQVCRQLSISEQTYYPWRKQ
jgi:hypothetical protein